ncbi:MAG: DegV family protein [Rhizobacter sp.]|nr:DegV family protein [Burkholderiales bacterium]
MKYQSINAGPTPRPPYSSDAFAYSMPGGFATTLQWGAHAPAADPSRANPGNEPDVARTLLVTDVACDLPANWLDQQRAVLLPMKLRFDSRTRSDKGDADAAKEFFRRDLVGVDAVGTDAQILPLSASGTYDFVADHLPEHADFVINVSLASHRANAYLNSLTSAQNLMLHHGRARRQAGHTRPFKMWVIDSTTAMNGQAVLVAESVRALNEGMSAARVVQHLDALRKWVHTIAVPRDVSFFRRHSRVDGETALSWLSYGIGKLLDRTPILHANAKGMSVSAKERGADAAITRALLAATHCVQAGLLVPCVCVSYAGDIAEVRQWPAFVALDDACIQCGVALHLGTMSMTNALTIGGKGLAISFACASLNV